MSLLEALLRDETQSPKERLETMQDNADDRLNSAVTEPATQASFEDIGVTGAAVVNESDDGDPIVVPIARFHLGEDVETLDPDAVWPVVPEALRVLDDAFEDVFVRHYDVQFTFDGDELFEAQQCKRVAVTPETVARLRTESGFGNSDLREYIETEDDIDDEIAPVAWRDAMDYSKSNSAVMVTSAPVGSGAAACAGASASAGACGAAGGAGP